MRAIYEDGIRGGDATFETEPSSWEAWAAAMGETYKAPASGAHCRRGWSSAPSRWATGR